MPACRGGWNKDMYFNRKQPLSSDIFLADRCKKTGSSRNRPERNKWIDYLAIDAKQGLSADLNPFSGGRISPPEYGQETTRSPPPYAGALSVSTAADLSK